MITSADNPRIRELKKLTSRKYRRKLGRFLVDDPKTIREALDAGLTPEAIYTSRPEEQRFENETAVAEHLLAPVSDQPSFSGWIAVFPMPDMTPALNTRRCLILEDLQDPANLGAICRSAVLLGIDSVWMTPDCADPFSLKTVRTAKGAIFRLKLVRIDLDAILTSMKHQGLPIIGADTRDGVPLSSFHPPAGYALALGHEGQGISETLRQACGHTVTIPTTGALESLNVSAAAAILLHHLFNSQPLDS